MTERNKTEKQLTVQINKSNCSLETKERKQKFDEARAKGIEDKYQEYRSQWSENPKNQVVSGYPLNVDVELSTACNLRCPMCPMHSESAVNKVQQKKFMDVNLFKKIVDELTANNVPALRLNYRGESTLHPQFEELVKYAKEKGIIDLNMTCNGSRFIDNDQFIEDVIPYMDWITFSVDGIYETFESVRKPLKFHKIVEMIKQIQEFKKKNNLVRPVIKIQSCWPKIKDTYEEYYNIFSEIADSVDFGIEREDTPGWSDNFEMENNYVCSKPYQSLIITVDGRAIPCCVDQNISFEVGDANNQSIKEIWTESKMQLLRRSFDNKNYIKLCRDCVMLRKHAEPEELTIGGRKVYVSTEYKRKND
ncbi:MAG: hypothetical protein A2Y25_01585 [Candidatus Melainabacteria bacterium GWF2_37_15]|nr:MAG: hypothetical protein A2Y25_01585 [Candidatus Melainabacteria bacterium GWF2_37_15]